MKITIYSGETTKDEARGVIALLMEIHGADVVPASAPRVGGVMNVVNVTNQVSDTPAADGFPTPPPVEHSTTPFPPSAYATPDAAGSLDSAGIPWDERIHSSTKGTNKDGTWSRRRNTPDELFASVMAELKAGIPKGAYTQQMTEEFTEAQFSPPPTEPTAAAAFAPPPPPPVLVNLSDEGTRTTGPAVIPPPPITPPVTGGARSFVEIMKTVTTAQTAGRLDKAKIDELMASCGLAGFGKLATADEGTRAAFDAVLTDALA